MGIYDMDPIYVNAIGNRFKKENIYLGTIVFYDVQSLLNELKKRTNYYTDYQLKKFIRDGELSNQQFEIFYKVENGYKRFLKSGSEILIGDNSDGKGFIENLVPIFDYYKDSELFEGAINRNIMIVATTMEPLEKYSKDYNLEESKRQ